MPRKEHNIGRQRSKNFNVTKNGLLTKRADLLGELISLDATRDSKRLDIEAIDRVLVNVLEYDGDLDAVKPTGQRIAYFKHGELGRAVMELIRDSDKALSAMEIAIILAKQKGKDISKTADRQNFATSITKACRRSEGRFVKRYVDPMGLLRWGSC